VWEEGWWSSWELNRQKAWGRRRARAKVGCLSGEAKLCKRAIN
jgi:hypothetical protein